MQKIYMGLVLSSLAMWVRADEMMHKHIVMLAMQQKFGNSAAVNFPFISSFDVKKEINTFYDPNGRLILGVPSKVTSSYDDTSTTYELSEFYTAKNTRSKIILNYFIPDTSVLLSIGYDSGSVAEKISIGMSKFIGFSYYKNFNSREGLYLMLGGWRKQKIAEIPCVDSYQRMYWCPALTAWSEHIPFASSNFYFADMRYELKF